MFIGIIAGLANLIPMVGPFIGMIPAILIALMNNIGSAAALNHVGTPGSVGHRVLSPLTAGPLLLSLIHI